MLFWLATTGWNLEDVQLLLSKSPGLGLERSRLDDFQWGAYWRGPVDSKAASTRPTEDKEHIDQFITRSIGFEKLNRLITDALYESSTNQAHINEGLRGIYSGGGAVALSYQVAARYTESRHALTPTSENHRRG